MSLEPGFRIGQYEVLAQLGAGGMGEVYRARDGRLDRDVALKVLPEALAADPDRLMRFEREAKALAALNHHNIAQLHGLEESDGTFALVMELVEGADLSDRLAAGPLPLDEALDIASQIASALEAAHETGIIHRDLKPANVKVRDDGVVKVLDFGLARAMEAHVARNFSSAPTDTGPGASDARATSDHPTSSDHPTVTSPAHTAMGMILGTAAYMSPEQARGKPVDKRADIWAFGVVLFEMLTGRRAFAAETVTDTLAAILTRDMDLGTLPPGTPAHVRHLLARCLERDPKQRLRDVGEARIALESGAVTEGPAPARAARVSRAMIPAAALLVATAAIAGWWIGSSQPRVDAARPASVAQLTDQAGEETEPSISPDGTSFAYASRAHGSWDIYVQRIGGRNPLLVAGDAARDESGPAFSPDGTAIAFHESDADGGIFLVGATGESARRLTEFGFHPSWSPDGSEIVFCTEEIDRPYARQTDSSLWVVGSGGGAPRKLLDGDAVQPSWSPSGTRIAYWSAMRGQRDIYTVDATGGTPLPVTEDAALDWGPAWSGDGRWLYFASDRGGAMNLWRIPLDEVSGATTGAPEAVTLGVHASLAQPSLSKDGSRIVFRSRLEAANPAVIPFDPAIEQLGTPRLLFRRTAVLVPTDVSPDGRWLALGNAGERQEDIFIARTDGSELSRLTDDAARDRVPRWSPDGTRLSFYSNRSGRYEIWAIGRDGGGLGKLTDLTEEELYFAIQSPATGRIVASANKPGRPLFMFDPARPWGDQDVVRLPVQLADGSSYGATSWSADGRRLAGRVMNRAGVATSLGIYDLQTRTLDRRGSIAPDFPTAWLPDNRRIVAMTFEGQLFLYDIESGREQVLAAPADVQLSNWSFAISPDGRAIYVGIVERESDIWMVENKQP